MLFDPEQNEREFTEFWSSIADEVGYAFVRPQWDTYFNAPHPENNEPCQNLWGRLYVWWDGTVNPCEQDYKSNLKLGKFPDKSIKELWHSSQLESLRNKHLNNKRKNCFPCDRCGWSSNI